MTNITIELNSSLDYLEEDLKKVIESTYKFINSDNDEVHVNVVVS